jgi:hypothetical protein
VVQRERRRTLRIPLKIGGPGFVRPGLNDEQRKVLYNVVLAGEHSRTRTIAVSKPGNRLAEVWYELETCYSQHGILAHQRHWQW